MGPFLMRFQIRDLEEFSGVRAHTIRIWEKRYGLLAPDRTETNIRTYGIDELKAILNIAYLNRNGYKISKIAALSPAQRDQLVRDVAVDQDSGGDTLNSLKMAMLSFNEVLFQGECDRFLKTNDFRSLVEKIFVPLLEQIGVLWQTSSICPAHEHFISNIIRQKLLAAIDALPVNSSPSDQIHILHLAENEIHELGLLYVNYLLRARGARTIYLGPSVPLHDLKQVGGMFPGQVNFMTILTTTPQPTDIPAYLLAMRSSLPEERFTFWLAGNQLGRVPDALPTKGMRLFTSMASLLAAVDEV